MTTPPSPASPPKPLINTRSAHNVQLWIKQGIAEGRLRRCWNLDIDIVEPRERTANGEMVESGESYFVPSCRHHSFESNISYASDEVQLRVLQHGLQTADLSCPKNCTYYRSKRWGMLSQGGKNIAAQLYSAGGALLKGFAGLSWENSGCHCFLGGSRNRSEMGASCYCSS